MKISCIVSLWVPMCLLINNLACIEILPYIKRFKPNPMLVTYIHNINRIKAFQDISKLTSKNLLRYGVVRISSSNSVIFNEELVEELMSPIRTTPTTTTTPIVTKPTSKPRRTPFRTASAPPFVEISYQNATFTRQPHVHTTLGKCIRNHSTQPATYIQGWSIEVGGAANFKVDFSTFLINLHPSLLLEFGPSVGISGTISCDVPPAGSLQFALTTEQLLISGVKQRRIKLTRFGIKPGPWETLPPFTTVNKRNVNIACITNPEFVSCD